LLMVGFVWTCVEYQFESNKLLAILGLSVTVWGALLMVSNFKFASLKQVDLQGRVPFVMILSAVFGLALFFTDPPTVMLLVALAYSFSGPFITVFKREQSV